MSLAYALPFFCDAMLYFGALGCLGLLRSCPDGLFFVPLSLLIGCWLSGRLTGQGRPRLRWLPVAVALPCAIAFGNWPARLTSLPMLIYLPLYVYNNRRAPDYDGAADRFRYSLIVAAFAMLVAVLIRSQSWKLGLPYLFLYFTLNMALLRLLRHDDAVARSRRFRLLNLSGVAAVCAAGFALSQPAVVSAIGALWRWFVQNVLLKLIALALYAVELAVYAAAWLLSRIPGFFGTGTFEPSQMQPLPDAAPELAGAMEQVRAFPPWVRVAIQAAGILLLTLIAVAVLRLLSRRVARIELPSGTDERESLDDEAPPRPRARLHRRAPEEGVRHWYRRALALLRARGGRIAPTMNTLQIQEESVSIADESALSELREVYLPVRYGEATATREDADRARAAYERLRREPPRQGG